MARLKNMTSGFLVINDGFEKPVKLDAGASVNVTDEVLYDPEIQRLVSQGTLKVENEKVVTSPVSVSRKTDSVAETKSTKKSTTPKKTKKTVKS